MENKAELIYYAGAALIAALAWLIRLEAKVMYLERDHETNKDKIWEKIDSVQASMTAMLATVSRIEGKLDVKTTKE